MRMQGADPAGHVHRRGEFVLHAGHRLRWNAGAGQIQNDFSLMICDQLPNLGSGAGTGQGKVSLPSCEDVDESFVEIVGAGE